MPSTEAQWLAVADGFNTKWQFPHCLGAMDGKHIVMKKPRNSGSTFYNYKHTFSIVLLAVVDPNYRFLYVDVGCQGRISDGGVFRNSSLYSAIQNNDVRLPTPDSLPDMQNVCPYVLVADDAFPLMENIMKPFAHRGLDRKERIFNYRLSRARRISENAFGIMSARFRVFRTAMDIGTDKARNVVLAAVVLHNYLMHSSDEDISEDELRRQHQLRSVSNEDTYSTENAKDVRQIFANYFLDIGQVRWQWNIE